MKRNISGLVGIVGVSFGLAACAVPPTQEQQAAATAVVALKAEGAPTYAPEELASIENKLAESHKMMEEQMKRSSVFRDFGPVVGAYAQITSDAAALRSTIGERKEAAKVRAEAAQATATQRVEVVGAMTLSAENAARLEEAKKSLARIGELMVAASYKEVETESQKIVDTLSAVTPEPDPTMPGAVRPSL